MQAMLYEYYCMDKYTKQEIVFKWGPSGFSFYLAQTLEHLLVENHYYVYLTLRALLPPAS
jgi:hypothetical protein